jgi:hypothetical protein
MKKNYIKIGLSIMLFSSTTALASTSVGTIDANSKITKVCKDATCTTFSQVNFKPTINSFTPGATPVTITDTNITGHLWGSELGWINMNPTGAGVAVNPTTGVLTGKAYANTGSWINFSPTTVSGGTNVGVTLVDNGAGSNFSGWAYASGPNAGWIKFDCANAATCIKTDWRTIPSRPTVVSNTGGGGGGGSYIYPPAVTSIATPTNIIAVATTTKPVTPLVNKPILIGGEESGVPSEFSSYVCKRYLKEYILPDTKNNPLEVKKLQDFLNEQGEKLTVDGTYDADDILAVKRFQAKYLDQIMTPWGVSEPTGRVYKTTTAKINLMMCAKQRGCPYFPKYLKQGDTSLETIKVQDFLNIIFAPTSGYPTNGLKLTKDFNNQTYTKLSEYQDVYKATVLKPWDLKSPTGRWYQTTRASANQLMNCSEGTVKLDNGVSVTR